MAATVFFQNAGGNDIATLNMVFNVSGTPTDPTTVSCVITDPVGNVITHTYNGASPADITRTGTGAYQLQVGCTTIGLWGYVWIATGTASDVAPGTFTVNPASQLVQFYTSVEELKDRLNITDTQSDMQLQFAVQAAARAIEGHTGRYFYQNTATRTFVPYDIYELPVNDLVSVTAFAVDNDGDGVFEQPWVQGTDYQLAVDEWTFNPDASGESRPYTWVRVINSAGGGKFFPFIWPFAPLNRIQISGVWGWPQVPYAVKQATLQTAAEYFKLKDSPFGILGAQSEFGAVRVPKMNPYILKLLSPYVSGRRKVGV